MPGELIFLLSLLSDGALAGALYALIALAFVLVYKSSRMMNFAVCVPTRSARPRSSCRSTWSNRS